MTQPELKEFIKNSAQTPIRICLTDGAVFRIAHPDFAFATSDSVIIASGPGHELDAEFVVCRIAQISRVEVLKRNGKLKH